MKKFKLITLFLIAISFSCQEKNTYILTEKEFIDMLVDIHLADAFYSNNQYGELKLAEIDSASYYKSIFEKYGVEKARFDSTLKTYTKQPAVMESIYDRVIDELKKVEAEQRKEEDGKVKTKSK